MNHKEIKDLIKLMNEHDLTEIEIEREGNKIKLKKATGEIAENMPRVSAQYNPEPKAASGADEVHKDADAGKAKVISPMVGTFYRAPSPDSPHFIEVGQTVEIGQVVCIVEAMKLMNEIKSEVKGKIVEIMVENAQPVEFGQTLFVVEPS